ncbi:hypothetical protein KC19_1G126100 [Ceratodon purpureus]|uniref:S-protein homolog n=1 Tax=Ceratodon purpureus TaxID=3225 RepID=A0A8T0J4F1_CERPU|nr:hypothetical protein KC19_1G126100 [Ceratodon purpureus]
MDSRKEFGNKFWSCLIVASAIACITGRLIITAQGAPLSSVTIWNYVGDQILVHCHDQFTDLEQQKVPHATDYVFTFIQNPDGTTMYTCSFVWGLNKSQEFPVWEGDKVQSNPVKNCGAGSFKCLYKVTKDGFYMDSAAASSGSGGLSNWFFINLWAVKSRVK